MKSTTPLSLEGAGVLIVDEDPAFQLGLKTFLKEFVGFSSVRVASNGMEALRILREDPSIELITLDYRMPEMDGLGLLETLRANPPRPLSVVMITGYPSEQLEEEFYRFHTQMLRTEYFIAKPVDFEQLEPVILRAHEALRMSLPAPAEISEPVETLEETMTIPAGSWESVADDPQPFLYDEPSTAWEPFAESMNARLDSLQQSLSTMEAKLDELGNRTPSLLQRFWIVVLALIFVLAAGFLAYQMDWFAQVADWIDRTLLLNRKGWFA